MATSSIGPTQDFVRAVYPTLPLFDGFQYLVTRVVPTLYHVTLLPEDAGELELALLARTQWRANRFDMCLVIGPERALFISGDGLDALASTPPRGGVLLTGRLKPARAWPETADLQARQRRLAAFIDERGPKKGYMLGDLTAGGRDATADDVARLAGAGTEGVPRGLERCPTCGEWRGTCLSQSTNFSCKVTTVCCYCQNDNRCAACGGFLYERKVNANFFNPRDGRIWHVPGFSGLNHHCPPTATGG